MHERTNPTGDAREKALCEPYLREDLQTLKAYFGAPTLTEGIVHHGIKRVLEIGVGSYPLWLDLEAVMQLSGLSRVEGDPVFSQEDIVASDPNINTDAQLIPLFTVRELAK